MSSKARKALLQGLEGLRAASLEPVVRQATPAGSILRRGLAISAFNLLETFVEGRMGELAEFINQGQVHFGDLPEALKARVTRRALEVAAGRLRRLDKVQITSFVSELGVSLASINGQVDVSTLAWLWPGSNMNTSDYHAVLKSFHVGKPWEDLSMLLTRLGFVGTSLKDDLDEFAFERHKSAHDSGHEVSILRISLVIDYLLKFSIGLDAFASVGAAALRNLNIDYLKDDAWTGGRIGLRVIRQRTNEWAEFTESGKRALKVEAELHQLQVIASSRCSDLDLLVVFDLHGQIIDWAVPTVG